MFPNIHFSPLYKAAYGENDVSEIYVQVVILKKKQGSATVAWELIV